MIKLHWTEQYLGLPWLTGGRDPFKGLDCWGLLCLVYRNEWGIRLSKHAAILSTREGTGVLAAEQASNQWTRLPLGEVEDGDAVVFTNHSLSHVGVFVNANGEPSILHAATRKLSSIVPLSVASQGFTEVAFYRHAQRLLH